jgi:hypothetical protein
MSELPTRDESTGQFTPNTDSMYGRELANAEAGFTTKKDEPADDKTYTDDLAGVQEAGRIWQRSVLVRLLESRSTLMSSRSTLISVPQTKPGAPNRLLASFPPCDRTSRSM